MIDAVVSLALLAAASGAIEPQRPDARPDSLGADWSQQQGQARECVRAGRCVPLNQVVDEVRRRIPGHLLDAGIEPGDAGKSVYHVRWAAADGRRMDVFADAVTGAIIRQEGR